jgi:hypothetical protein
MESDMTFIVAGCVLLLALFASIVLDNFGAGKPREARRDVASFDAW